jgi:hypothetical protein
LTWLFLFQFERPKENYSLYELELNTLHPYIDLWILSFLDNKCFYSFFLKQVVDINLECNENTIKWIMHIVSCQKVRWYNPFWDLGTSKKVMGSNLVVCKSCYPSTNKLDFGVPIACHFKFVVEMNEWMKMLKSVWIFEMIIITFPWIDLQLLVGLIKPKYTWKSMHNHIACCIYYIIVFVLQKIFNKHLVNNKYQFFENTQMYFKIHMNPHHTNTQMTNNIL